MEGLWLGFSIIIHFDKLHNDVNIHNPRIWRRAREITRTKKKK